MLQKRKIQVYTFTNSKGSEIILTITENKMKYKKHRNRGLERWLSSSKRLGFNSQYLCGSSRLSVTPVPGNLTPSHRKVCRQNSNTCKIKINYLKK